VRAFLLENLVNALPNILDDFMLSLTPKTLTLNQGQQAAADGVFQFLFDKEPCLCLSGAGGTGKTTLMSDIIDRVLPEYFKTCKMMGIEPEYDSVVMTATTNKAAEVVAVATKRPTETIHSFLRLKVTDDYATGKSKLTKRNDWTVHEKKIIFIDEAYMIDGGLLQLIYEGTHKCKIIFVGDHCQLAPVMETHSPIAKANFPFFQLTENVRNAGQPALMAVCQQLRTSVETGVFEPIQIIPGVIDLADDEQMADAITAVFHAQTRDARILAYTNQKVVAYNDFIRNIRSLPDEYGRGEFLVNNQAIKLGNSMLSIEEEVEILDQNPETEQIVIGKHNKENIILEVRRSTLRSRLGSYYNNSLLPVDRVHYAELVKWYSRRKEWERYYYLKKTFPDLRPRDAATVHKAQGSTYDVVFIDIGDISSCHQPITAARLLYVAFTRAKNRVVLYGDLAQKYGGLIQ
jgi:energy-coupling factor transporter ATP-binding protein EcfA2